jgi:hypothetical protein
MTNLVLTLDPEKLANPDLDLRYIIPDLLAERSNGNIKADGYDYEDREENPASPLMAIFLIAENLPSALKDIGQLLVGEEVLGNHLSQGAVLYIEQNGSRTSIAYGEGHA